jgi:hypothetical protein
VGQTIGINSEEPLDAGNQLAAIKPFVLGRVGILHALRVGDQHSRLRIPPKALSNFANHIFLTLPAGGFGRLRQAHLIFESKRGRCAIWASRTATSATDSRFSAHTTPRRKPHKHQPQSAWLSSAPATKQATLSLQKLHV